MSTEPLETDYTITGCYAGYPVTIEVRGNLAALPRLVERMRALGVEPAAAAPQKPAQRAQQAAEPRYADDGTACCPWHQKPLKEGRYGLYCPSRAEGEHANDKGYCTFQVRA